MSIDFQGDEKIDDFSWNRFKVSKKVLKIRSAELDDTGIYHCKGVNGFGTENVRIELIVVGKLATCDYSRFEFILEKL